MMRTDLIRCWLCGENCLPSNHDGALNHACLACLESIRNIPKAKLEGDGFVLALVEWAASRVRKGVREKAKREKARHNAREINRSRAFDWLDERALEYRRTYNPESQAYRDSVACQAQVCHGAVMRQLKREARLP